MNKVLIIVFLSLLGLIMGLRQVRSLNNENVALQIEYLGTCQDFIKRDLASIRISSHLPGACLPLLPGGVSIPFKGEFNDPDLFYSDINDLESDYFCTDLDGPKALIHFVDVYNKQKQIVTDYLLSFVPSSPFKAKSSDVVYTRRPSCETDKLMCPPYTETVTNCTPNVIQFGAILEKGKNFLENAYVITRDRIYLSTSKNVPSICDDGVSCCTYIASRENKGMCPFTNGDFVLPFLEDYELHTTVNNEHKDLMKQNPHIKQVYSHKKVSHKPHHSKPVKVQHKQIQEQDVDSDDFNAPLSFNRHSPSNKNSHHAPDRKEGKVYHHAPKSN